MQTIKLDVNDNIFDKVICFLNNLPKKDVKIKIEDGNENKKNIKKLKAVSLKTKGYKFSRDEANER